MRKRWYILLEETGFDTLSVSGPLSFGDAVGVVKKLDRTLTHASGVIANEQGHVARHFDIGTSV